jgi:hypothetical protein
VTNTNKQEAYALWYTAPIPKNIGVARLLCMLYILIDHCRKVRIFVGWGLRVKQGEDQPCF